MPYSRRRRRYGRRRLSSAANRRSSRRRPSSRSRSRRSRSRSRTRFGRAAGLGSGTRGKFVYQFSGEYTQIDNQIIASGNVPSDCNATAALRVTPNLWVSKAGAYRRWVCYGSRIDIKIVLAAVSNNAKFFTLGAVPSDSYASVTGRTAQQLAQIPGFTSVRPLAGNNSSRFLRFRRYASTRSVLGFRPSVPDDAFQWDVDWANVESKRTWMWILQSSNFQVPSDQSAFDLDMRITYYVRLFNPTDVLGN